VRGKAGGKVMRENEPVLLVLSVCDGKIILEKGEILYEKCQLEKKLTCILSVVASRQGFRPASSDEEPD